MKLEQTLRLTNTLPKTVTKQDTLFGTDFFAETLLVERSQLLNWAKKNINKRSAAFKTIVENDTTLQKAGNKLNKLNNEEQRLIYEQVGERFEQIATRVGAELSDKLTKAAQLLKDGKDQTQKNSSSKLSMTQLRKEILEGAMLASHLELTKLKLRHQRYLRNLKKT